MSAVYEITNLRPPAELVLDPQTPVAVQVERTDRKVSDRWMLAGFGAAFSGLVLGVALIDMPTVPDRRPAPSITQVGSVLGCPDGPCPMRGEPFAGHVNPQP
jgi:hypothetical protein